VIEALRVASKLKPNARASAATSFGSGLRNSQRGSETRFWRANAPIASGVSKGWLNPMLTTWKASGPSASRACFTAFARYCVATGQAWKQPV
jgi:hypothetical protein